MKKLLVELKICLTCGAVYGVPDDSLEHCGAMMVPLKAALRADGQAIAFYTDEILLEAIDKKV